MAPVLEKSKLPKVIFVSSLVGSIQRLSEMEGAPWPFLHYASSKASLNYLAVWYAKKYPQWKINAVCPGYRATGLNGAELTEDTDPALGAIRVVELVKEGLDGVTGTYSSKDEQMPW